VAWSSREGSTSDPDGRIRLVADVVFCLPAWSIGFEATNALSGSEFARRCAVRAEEARELADEVLEFGIVIRASLGHLDHMEQIAGHARRPFVTVMLLTAVVRSNSSMCCAVIDGCSEAV